MSHLPALKGQRQHKSALTGFHARVLFVDNINPATTTYYTAVFVTHFGRFQAVSDFHGLFFSASSR